MSQRKIPPLFISRAFPSLAATCLDYRELPSLIRNPRFPASGLSFVLLVLVLVPYL